MSLPQLPAGARIIRTYRALEELVDAFFAGHFDLLILIGPPGLAKSRSFEKRMSKLAHRIHGYITALAAYIECYRNRHKNLVIDDAETLWESRAGRVLIRSLCETRSEKTVEWQSSTHELQKNGVPQRFTTTSRVALITNGLTFGNAAERAAVLDRAHVVYFDPTAAEVHRQVAQWFWDQSVFDFFGENLHRLAKPSMRSYVKATQLHAAGGDWRAYVAESCFHDATTHWVQALETDPSCPTVTLKVAKFIAETGNSRATYFNIKRQLKADDQLIVPEKNPLKGLKVQGVVPTRPDIEEAVANAEREDAAAAKDPHEHETPEISSTHGEGQSEKGRKTPPYTEVPDDDPKGWAKRQLAKALRRNDYGRIVELRKLLDRLEKGGTSEEAA